MQIGPTWNYESGRNIILLRQRRMVGIMYFLFILMTGTIPMLRKRHWENFKCRKFVLGASIVLHSCIIIALWVVRLTKVSIFFNGRKWICSAPFRNASFKTSARWQRPEKCRRLVRDFSKIGKSLMSRRHFQHQRSTGGSLKRCSMKSCWTNPFPPIENCS